MTKPYTLEQTQEMTELYKAQPCRETVKYLATKLQKTEKSVISKLSVEGVYKREIYTSKTGETPITKADIVADICSYLELEVEDLLGLEKAPKQALKRLELAVQEWFGNE